MQRCVFRWPINFFQIFSIFFPFDRSFLTGDVRHTIAVDSCYCECVLSDGDAKIPWKWDGYSNLGRLSLRKELMFFTRILTHLRQMRSFVKSCVYSRVLIWVLFIFLFHLWKHRQEHLFDLCTFRQIFIVLPKLSSIHSFIFTEI